MKIYKTAENSQEEDFKLVIKLLQPFDDMSADMREEELKDFTL